MSNSIYQKVPTAHVPMSMFDNHFTNKMTGKLGMIYPIAIKQMLPGDVFKISQQAYLKFMPSVNPIFHDIYVKTRWFFVPHRLVDEDFEEAITGGEDGESEKTFPIWNPDAVGSKAAKTSVCVHDTLWDYFNFPLLDTETSYSGSLSSETTFDNECMPLAYPLRAYNRVWNDWFRDEETQEKIVENEVEDNYNYTILRVNWHKDRFTSAGQEEQRGTAPALPLSGTLPVIFDTTLNQNVLKAEDQFSPRSPLVQPFKLTGDTNTTYTDDTFTTASEDGHKNVYSLAAFSNYTEYKKWLDEGTTTTSSGPILRLASHLIPFGSNNYYQVSNASYRPPVTSEVHLNGNVNLNNAGTFTIKDIRLTNAIQKWQERNEECGSRYGEYLRGQYGVYPKDERLQRPEYIGGSVTPVVTSPVLQNSESTSGNPLGKEATRATALDSAYIGTYKAFEFGTLLGVMYVVPKASYISQGFPAEWMYHDKFEFPNPLFSHLGNMPVKNGEIYAKGFKQSISGGTVTPGDDTVFGWQGKDDEMRDSLDKTSSGFRTAEFNNWTFDRSFTDYPGNNSNFRQVNLDSNNVFIAQNSYHFAAYVGIGLKTVRPLPKFATPLLG